MPTRHCTTPMCDNSPSRSSDETTNLGRQLLTQSATSWQKSIIQMGGFLSRFKVCVCVWGGGGGGGGGRKDIVLRSPKVLYLKNRICTFFSNLASLPLPIQRGSGDIPHIGLHVNIVNSNINNSPIPQSQPD